MKKKPGLLLFLFAIIFFMTHIASAQKSYEVQSPDKTIKMQVQAGSDLTWSVTSNNAILLKTSPVSLQLANGENIGKM